MKLRLATTTIHFAMAVAQSTLAQDAGEWLVRGGFHSLEPKSRNHELVEVEDTMV